MRNSFAISLTQRVSVTLLLSFAAALHAQPANLDATVERVRQAFDVPGIAVAIVKDGKVVLAKGYGVRKLGGSAPVTPQSLFRIASNTKAFTTAALAILVDEGKLKWDDRVVDRFPSFQMHDPYVTREMTIRDLLTHRSGLGLGAGDLMFWPATDLEPAEILRRIRYIPLASSFRSKYAYDNLLYLVAGHIIETASGKPWEQFLRERIWTPLGMTHTFGSTRALVEQPDVAQPHARADGKLVVLEQTNHDNNAPAGSVNSCVEDLAKWMLLQLDHGGKIFTAAQSKEMWSPQTIMPIRDQPKGAPAIFTTLQPQFSAYGLGWGLRDYRGHKLVGHTGQLAGYVSRTTLVPDLNLGIVILTNQEENAAHSAIANTVVDRYLAAPAVDWVSDFVALTKIEKAEGEAEAAKMAGKRNADSRPSLPLASYVGRYRDAWYGDVLVENRNGKLTIRFTHSKQLGGDLEHWQYDTFVARWRDRTLFADAYVTFSLKPDGTVEGAKMEPVSPLTDFSFDFQDLALKRVSGGVF
jgi:CubicO group peptidase (beta-lactamase class C family)